MTGGSFQTNTYDIPKTLLELDPDLCQFFFSSFLCQLTAHADMYDTLKKSCAQGLCSLFLYLKALISLS